MLTRYLLDSMGSVSDTCFHARCVPVQVPRGAGSSEGGFWVLFAPGSLVGLWEGAEGGGELLSCSPRDAPDKDSLPGRSVSSWLIYNDKMQRGHRAGKNGVCYLGGWR